MYLLMNRSFVCDDNNMWCVCPLSIPLERRPRNWREVMGKFVGDKSRRVVRWRFNGNWTIASTIDAKKLFNFLKFLSRFLRF